MSSIASKSGTGNTFTDTGKWWQADEDETNFEMDRHDNAFLDASWEDRATFRRPLPAHELNPPNEDYRRRNNQKPLDGFPEMIPSEQWGLLTRAQWVFLLEFYGYACAYCRQRPLSVDDWDSDNQCEATLCIEHVTPRWKGGTHSFNNIVPACHICNQDKRGLTIKDWLPRMLALTVHKNIEYCICAWWDSERE